MAFPPAGARPRPTVVEPPRALTRFIEHVPHADQVVGPRNPTRRERANQRVIPGFLHTVRLEPLVLSARRASHSTVMGLELVPRLHDQLRRQPFHEPVVARRRETVVRRFQPIHLTNNRRNIVLVAVRCLQIGRQVGAPAVRGHFRRVRDQVSVRHARPLVVLIWVHRNDLDTHVTHLDSVIVSGRDVLVESATVSGPRPVRGPNHVIVDLLIIPQMRLVRNITVGILGRVNALRPILVNDRVSVANMV